MKGGHGASDSSMPSPTRKTKGMDPTEKDPRPRKQRRVVPRSPALDDLPPELCGGILVLLGPVGVTRILSVSRAFHALGTDLLARDRHHIERSLCPDETSRVNALMRAIANDDTPTLQRLFASRLVDSRECLTEPFGQTDCRVVINRTTWWCIGPVWAAGNVSLLDVALTYRATRCARMLIAMGVPAGTYTLDDALCISIRCMSGCRWIVHLNNTESLVAATTDGGVFACGTGRQRGKRVGAPAGRECFYHVDTVSAGDTEMETALDSGRATWTVMSYDIVGLIDALASRAFVAAKHEPLAHTLLTRAMERTLALVGVLAELTRDFSIAYAADASDATLVRSSKRVLIDRYGEWFRDQSMPDDHGSLVTVMFDAVALGEMSEDPNAEIATFCDGAHTTADMCDAFCAGVTHITQWRPVLARLLAIGCDPTEGANAESESFCQILARKHEKLTARVSAHSSAYSIRQIAQTVRHRILTEMLALCGCVSCP